MIASESKALPLRSFKLFALSYLQGEAKPGFNAEDLSVLEETSLAKDLPGVL